jgi:hypothetical protein
VGNISLVRSSLVNRCDLRFGFTSTVHPIKRLLLCYSSRLHKVHFRDLCRGLDQYWLAFWALEFLAEVGDREITLRAVLRIHNIPELEKIVGPAAFNGSGFGCTGLGLRVCNRVPGLHRFAVWVDVSLLLIRGGNWDKFL